jgi:hypothetical protein
MTPVAKALGLSTSDVRAQLRSGKSLNELAAGAGLAHDDLIAAIRAGLPSSATNRRSTTSATGPAGTAATGRGGAASTGPGGAPSTGLPGAASTVAAATAATGTGPSLAAGATGASTTAGDSTAIAERIAAAKGRPRPDGFGGSGDGSGSSSAGDGSRVIGDQGKLSALSTQFNVKDGSLNSASSAKELVDLLQQNGADLSQLKNVLKSGDLLNTTA